MKIVIAIFVFLLPSFALAQIASRIPSSHKGDLVARPHYCNNYSSEAMQAKLVGTTLIHFTIGTDGGVSDISISQSSGHPELDDAAIACVKHWKYHPAMKGGVPIAVPWTATIQWALPENPAGDQQQVPLAPAE